MTGYTRANIRALVEALVPRTPELEQTHGPESVPGSRDIDLDSYVIESLNGYQEHHLGPLSTLLRKLGIRNYPYAVLVALLLDVVALELVIRRENDQPMVKRSLTTPFARLDPQDRLRAIALLETGALDTLATRVERWVPMVGTVRFLALGVNAFPLLGYYSEWATADPEQNQAWQQTGYPGPADGHSEHMGYEVETFTDDWDGDTDHASYEQWDPDQFESWPPDDFGDVGGAQ